MTARRFAACLGLGCLFLSGCGGPAPDKAASASAAVEPVVRTTFYPTTYFAERITGGLVPVECPLPDGADPIFWEPSAEVINAYQRAALVVVNGAEFEKWAVTAPLPRSRVIETAQNFDGPLITIEGTTHSHGPEGEHTHDGVDGHTWLDPLNAIAQAETLTEALADAFPQHEAAFRDNFAALRSDLTALHERLRALPAAEATLIASHPAYNYLARRYGWAVTTVDVDPEAPLTAQATEALREKIGDPGHRPAVMLWESQPIDETRDAAAGLGLVNVLYTPVESLDAEARAAGEDYLSVMNANVDRLAAALR